MFRFLFYIVVFSPLVVIAQNKLETVVQRGHEKPVTCAVFSHGGHFVASGSMDNSIKIWDAYSGFEIRTIHQHTAKILDLVFDPIDSKIASVASDNQIMVHDVGTGKLLYHFQYEKNNVSEIRFAVDGKYLITLDNADNELVWSLTTNALDARYEKNYGGRFNSRSLPSKGLLIPTIVSADRLAIVNAVSHDTLLSVPYSDYYSSSFSGDGKYMAIGSEKLITNIVDLNQQKIIHTLISDTQNECWGCNTKVTFANKSNLLLSGTSKNGLSLWDASEGKKIYTLPIEEERFEYLEFSFDDQYFLEQGDDICKVFETKTGKEMYRFTNDYLDYFTVHFSPNSHQILVPSKNNTFSIVDFIKKTNLLVLQGYLNHDQNDGVELSYSNWIEDKILQYVSMKTQIAIHPKLKYLAKGNVDSSVFILDIQAGKVVKKLKGHSKLVYRLQYTSDGEYLATAGADRKIIIWETKTWTQVATLKGHVALVFDLKFNHDNTQLVSSAWDGYVITWDMKSFQSIDYQTKDKSSVYSLTYSPDNLYLIQHDLEQKNEVKEVDSKELFYSLIGHTHIVSESVFDTQNHLFSSSWDGSIKKWDFNSGRLLAKYKKHQGAVLCLAYDSIQNILLSGGMDGKLTLWDLKTDQLLKQIDAHSNALTSIVMGDKIILTSSADGEVKVWDFNTLQELYTYRQINQEDWLVTNPSGYFDGTANAQKLVNYVKGMEVLPISSFFNKYFTPNLSKRIMSGERFSYNEKEFNQDLKLVPELSVAFAVKDNHLTKNDSLWVSKSDYVFLDAYVHSAQSLQHTTHLYRNGKLIKDIEMIRGVDVVEKHIAIHLTNGKNNISVWVENELGYESQTKEFVVYLDGKKAKTDLYVLAIGVNEYKNTNYELKYACNDAKTFAEKLMQNEDSLFEKRNLKYLSNKDATKLNIMEAMKEISKEIGPEDVFVFFFAGHGIMSIEESEEQKKFFLIPYDQQQLYTSSLELSALSISAQELTEMSAELAAEKQLFVLDACQSGGALPTFASRGFDREKAIAQLARSTGTYFMTASLDYQFANESNVLEHGMFTYAILEAMSGKDEAIKQDSKITVNELKTYVEERVPELSKIYQTPLQYPQSYGFGQDFPLVLLAR